MQTSIAKFSKSIFVKILVGIIILPFVFWGMGDIFRGGNQNILVTIDSEKVSTQEFINYVNRLNLNETERKEISNTNLLERIVSEYTGRKIIDLEEKNMGIIINNNSLKNIITNDKTFFKDGKFSRTEYEKFLIKSSITAPAFEQNIIEQEKRRQLLSFLSSGVIVPKHMVEKEFNKENQIKTIKYIDLANFYKNRPPKKDEIKKIYDENKQIFFENFKIINFLKLTPELLIGKSDYDKVFFSKIEKIENSILDGMTITMIATNNDLKFSTTEEINKKKLNKNGVKYNKISDDLFDKAIYLK
jgi:peptidyl-prolyl cis-trans isomerase D